jgi:hypothetical protein
MAQRRSCSAAMALVDVRTPGSLRKTRLRAPAEAPEAADGVGAGAPARSPPPPPGVPHAWRGRRSAAGSSPSVAAAAAVTAGAIEAAGSPARSSPGGGSGWAWATLAAAAAPTPPPPRRTASGRTPSPQIPDDAAGSPDLLSYRDPNEDVWWSDDACDYASSEDDEDRRGGGAASGSGGPCRALVRLAFSGADTDRCSRGGSAPRLALALACDSSLLAEHSECSGLESELELEDEDENEKDGGSGNYLDIEPPCAFPPGGGPPRFELLERLGQVRRGRWHAWVHGPGLEQRARAAHAHGTKACRNAWRQHGHGPDALACACDTIPTQGAYATVFLAHDLEAKRDVSAAAHAMCMGEGALTACTARPSRSPQRPTQCVPRLAADDAPCAPPLHARPQVAIKVSLDRWTARRFASKEEVALYRATVCVRSRCEDEHKVGERGALGRPACLIPRGPAACCACRGTGARSHLCALPPAGLRAAGRSGWQPARPGGAGARHPHRLRLGCVGVRPLLLVLPSRLCSPTRLLQRAPPQARSRRPRRPAPAPTCAAGSRCSCWATASRAASATRPSSPPAASPPPTRSLRASPSAASRRVCLGLGGQPLGLQACCCGRVALRAPCPPAQTASPFAYTACAGAELGPCARAGAQGHQGAWGLLEPCTPPPPRLPAA